MLLKILTGILIVMFPVGLAIMLTGFANEYLWTTTIFLGLQALILFLIVCEYLGFVKSALLVFIIMLLSFAIELLGVRTGFPFGSYSYSRVLMPLIAGVPVAITFAWFSVAVSAYLITSGIFSKMGSFAVVFLSSVLILAFDILLEPFAAFINGFWVWDLGTIPFQNFVSWLVLGFLFCLLVSVFIPAEKVRSGLAHRNIPYIILFLNILNFLILNIIYGYILLSVIAITLIIWVLLIMPMAVKHEA